MNIFEKSRSCALHKQSSIKIRGSAAFRAISLWLTGKGFFQSPMCDHLDVICVIGVICGFYRFRVCIHLYNMASHIVTGYIMIRPWRMPSITASVRVEAPSLEKIEAT